MNAICRRIYTYTGVNLQLGNNRLGNVSRGRWIYASLQHNGSEAKACEANFISKYKLLGRLTSWTPSPL